MRAKAQLFASELVEPTEDIKGRVVMRARKLENRRHTQEILARYLTELAEFLLEEQKAIDLLTGKR